MHSSKALRQCWRFAQVDDDEGDLGVGFEPDLDALIEGDVEEGFSSGDEDTDEEEVDDDVDGEVSCHVRFCSHCFETFACENVAPAVAAAAAAEEGQQAANAGKVRKASKDFARPLVNACKTCRRRSAAFRFMW